MLLGSNWILKSIIYNRETKRQINPDYHGDDPNKMAMTMTTTSIRKMIDWRETRATTRLGFFEDLNIPSWPNFPSII